MCEIILAAAIEAQAAIDRELVSRQDITGTAFDQAGIADGLQIVREYLAAGEAGVAVEHVRYMLEETGVGISARTSELLDDVCRRMKVRSINSKSI